MTSDTIVDVIPTASEPSIFAIPNQNIYVKIDGKKRPIDVKNTFFFGSNCNQTRYCRTSAND